jgi:hypothetical protein
MPKIIYGPETVTVSDQGNGRFILYFSSMDARYHISLDGDLNLEPGCPLYKNPPIETPRYLANHERNPADFSTRQLDPAAKENAALLDELLDTVRRDGLIAKATAEREANEAEEKRRFDLKRALHNQREAGPILFAALETLLERAGAGATGEPLREAMAAAEAALAAGLGANRREFFCRPKGADTQSRQGIYAATAEIAAQEYALRNLAGQAVLPDEIDVSENRI